MTEQKALIFINTSHEKYKSRIRTEKFVWAKLKSLLHVLGLSKSRCGFLYFLQVNTGIESYNTLPHLPSTDTPNDQSLTVYRRSTWLTSHEARNFRSTAGSTLNLMMFYRTLKIKCSQLNKLLHFKQTIHTHNFYTFK